MLMVRKGHKSSQLQAVQLKAPSVSGGYLTTTYKPLNA